MLDIYILKTFFNREWGVILVRKWNNWNQCKIAETIYTTPPFKMVIFDLVFCLFYIDILLSTTQGCCLFFFSVSFNLWEEWFVLLLVGYIVEYYCLTLCFKFSDDFFQLFSSENCSLKVAGHSQNRSKMTILKTNKKQISHFSQI
jgi:hypothetical protein